MMKRRGRDYYAHWADEDEVPASTECLTFDNYQCTSNVEVDFPKLCSLLDLINIPHVYRKTTDLQHVSSKTTDRQNVSSKTTDRQNVSNKTTDRQHVSSKATDRQHVSNKTTDRQHVSSKTTDLKARDEKKAPEEKEPQTTTRWTEPCLHLDLEDKNILSCTGLKIMGWNVDEEILQVLNKLIQDLDGIQSLYFWQAGLTDKMVKSLSNTLSLGCNVRVVHLEGNPLPKHSYHLLLSEDNVITKLFLQNNQIGDEGARLIGSALSTTKKTHLFFLNLAFNRIGDAGAGYIAQGLRYNRALIYLSLANNQIGDSGAASLSKILPEFTLTHEEVVERRKMLAERIEPNLSPEPEELPSGTNLAKPEHKTNTKKKKEDKPKKELLRKSTPKQPKSPPPPSKGGKSTSKRKSALVDHSEMELSILLAEPEGEKPEVEIVNPLLDPLVYCIEGQWFHPGNSTLVYLSLAGNAITKKSLPLFLSSLEQQTYGGLRRLHLNRNRFPPDCELANKIDQLLKLRIVQDHQKTKADEE